MTATRPALETHIRRELYCPSCRRFLGSAGHPQSLQPGQIWVRLFCRACNKFVVFDQVTGAVRRA